MNYHDNDENSGDVSDDDDDDQLQTNYDFETEIP